MRSGALGEMTVLEGGPGFDIGVEDSHPQPDDKRGSPLYVEFAGPPLAQRRHRLRRRSGTTSRSTSRTASRRSSWTASPCDGRRGQGRRAAPPGPLTIGDPHHDKPLKGDVGDLRIYDRALTPAEAEALALHEPIRYILAQEESKRSQGTERSACSITSSPTTPRPICAASTPSSTRSRRALAQAQEGRS